MINIYFFFNGNDKLDFSCTSVNTNLHETDVEEKPVVFL